MGLNDKPPSATPLPRGSRWRDTYQYARNEWDDRLGDAAAQVRHWRRGCLASCAVTALSIVAAAHFAENRDRRPIVVVVRGISGDVLSVARSDGSSGVATRADIASGLKRWVRELRTVSTDATLMQSGIRNAYKMISAGSIAMTAMSANLNLHEPFARAKSEVVALSQMSAIPNPGTVDAQGNQTWEVRWTETVTARDSTSVTQTPWYASVTFRIGVPSTEDQEANPDGIFINNYSWEPAR